MVFQQPADAIAIIIVILHDGISRSKCNHKQQDPGRIQHGDHPARQAVGSCRGSVCKERDPFAGEERRIGDMAATQGLYIVFTV